ncbi:MAG TPA: CRTAC1 family protein [Fimbriiglobus sp.]|nr:CRTAC1 family protein [Fimbriiglobus sp.]
MDVAAAAGIGFRHFDPATPRNYILETMGSGLGWIDYDNDGWLDLFCVQDGTVQPASADGPPPTNKLYRNNGDGTFTDVTETVGLARAGFGTGCAVGDYDNDGYDDLAVTYWGGVVLYHNEHDGHGGRRFVDVTARAGGLHDPHWATSCGWGDIDGDGDLDLYVCNYVEVDLANYPLCEHGDKKVIFSCSPNQFAAVTHRLYRNEGNGTFADVTDSSGVAAASPAPGLGVVLTDLDGDGRIDIYAANDMRPAYLFHNQGGGKFVEKGLFSGCAVGSSGENIAGMGVDAGDVDDSGRPSLFVTNFHGVPNVLFLNAGRMLFRYGTHSSGLGVPSLSRLGFGTVFCDVDLDGRLDLAVANGHVERHAAEVYNAPYAQEAQLFLGQGPGRFRDGSAEAGAYFREPRVGRGLAWADFDNDGRPDLAYSHVGGPIALLHNRTETAHGWLRLELIGDGKTSNRNAIGARVEIETTAGKQVRFVNGGGSYLSASERRLLVGLGPARRAERVAVRWPSGREQTFTNLEGRRWWRLREGEATPEVVEPKLPSKGR